MVGNQASGTGIQLSVLLKISGNMYIIIVLVVIFCIIMNTACA